ncbi:ribonuclease HII [Nakamurella flava]|nr:ribonuclease HII [Nakamurella flava]
MTDLIDTRWGDLDLGDPVADVEASPPPADPVRRNPPAVRSRRSPAARKGAPVVRRPHLRVEKELFRSGGVTRLAGMDEVGRGALAGPVTVGVVVVTQTVGRVPTGLRDSKLLTPAARDALVTPVRRWAADFGVGHAGPEEIDEHGIMVALRLAGERALAQLAAPVDAVLLDGNYNYLTPRRPAGTEDDGPDGDAEGLFDAPAVTGPAAPAVHVRIKADMTCAAVAAASILAKTERDRLLVGLAERHPAYGLEINKGYCTPDHSAALRRWGASPVHRRSWRLPGEDPGLFGGSDVPIGFEEGRAEPAPHGGENRPRER